MKLLIREDVLHRLDMDIEIGGVYMVQNMCVCNNDKAHRVTNHTYKLIMTRYFVITYINIEKITTIGLTPVPVKDVVNMKALVSLLIGWSFQLM